MILSFLLLTVSAPADTGPTGAIKLAECPTRSLVMYTTNLGKLKKSHLSQSFLLWTVEDRPRQEDSR